MRRASLLGLVVLVTLSSIAGHAQTRRTDPLAAFRGLTVDALIEQAASPVPEARALIACTLRERKAAAASALKMLLAMLADVERSLSARQRAVAVARLREYARDFQLLAAAKVAQGAPRDR